MLCQWCGNTKTDELEEMENPTFYLYQCKRGFGCMKLDNSIYEDILETVVSNGRLTSDATVHELEVEIDFEARVERNLSDDETKDAIQYAKEHYKFNR